jgi:hypothetical protein
VKNRPTRRKFVVSTIRKDENLFETAIFETNFFYFPRSLSQPELTMQTSTPEEAWNLHYRLTARLIKEYPGRLIQEYRQAPPSAPPKD